MAVSVYQTDVKDILPLRSLYLQENNFQIRYNACHERGWTDSYIIKYNEQKIGYGSVKGKDNIKDRNTVFEFYIIPSFQNQASLFFAELLHISKAVFIECQSNDWLLTSMLYQHAHNINSDVILFEEHTSTLLIINNVCFRQRHEQDDVFEHRYEPVGDYVLEWNKQVVATGGFLLHYNFPFADLYMEVKENHRKKGLGSYLIQQLKTQCYLAGRVPAARCNIDNTASKASLLKAGFRIAGFMLSGTVNRQ